MKFREGEKRRERGGREEGRRVLEGMREEEQTTGRVGGKRGKGHLNELFLMCLEKMIFIIQKSHGSSNKWIR